MAQEEFTDFEIDINTEGEEAWNGERRPLVPPGDYTLEIVNVKQSTTKEKQVPQLAVTFKVVDEGEHKDSFVYGNYNLAGKGVSRLKSLQLACRTSLDKLRASEFMGVQIRATVTHTEGDPKIDANGVPQPAKTFANVSHELPIDDQPAEQPAKTQPKTPPVTKTATKPATNGAARRA